MKKNKKNESLIKRMINTKQASDNKLQSMYLNKKVETEYKPVIKEHVVITVPNKGLTIYSINESTEIKQILSCLYKSSLNYIEKHIIHLKNDVQYTKIVFTGKTYKIYTNLTTKEVFSIIDRFNSFTREFIDNHIISDRYVINKIPFNCKYLDIFDIY